MNEYERGREEAWNELRRAVIAHGGVSNTDTGETISLESVDVAKVHAKVIADKDTFRELIDRAVSNVWPMSDINEEFLLPDFERESNEMDAAVEAVLDLVFPKVQELEASARRIERQQCLLEASEISAKNAKWAREDERAKMLAQMEELLVRLGLTPIVVTGVMKTLGKE